MSFLFTVVYLLFTFTILIIVAADEFPQLPEGAQDYEEDDGHEPPGV